MKSLPREAKNQREVQGLNDAESKYFLVLLDNGFQVDCILNH